MKKLNIKFNEFQVGDLVFTRDKKYMYVILKVKYKKLCTCDECKKHPIILKFKRLLLYDMSIKWLYNDLYYINDDVTKLFCGTDKRNILRI